MIISQQDFTRLQIERMAREFPVSAGPGRDVVVFSIFTDLEDAAMAATRSHESYRGWKVDYDVNSVRKLRAANVVAIGQDAVLRMRHADGTVMR